MQLFKPTNRTTKNKTCANLFGSKRNHEETFFSKWTWALETPNQFLRFRGHSRCRRCSLGTMATLPRAPRIPPNRHCSAPGPPPGHGTHRRPAPPASNQTGKSFKTKGKRLNQLKQGCLCTHTNTFCSTQQLHMGAGKKGGAALKKPGRRRSFVWLTWGFVGELWQC